MPLGIETSRQSLTYTLFGFLREGWTATALALNDTREIMNSINGLGARPNSEGIPKIAVLLTDGKSNQHPLTFAAPALKDAGVQVCK